MIAIADHMAVPADQRDLGWIKSALQTAISLEHATMPPYIAAIYSLKAQNYTAYNLPTAAGTFTPYLNGNLCIIRGVVSPTANGNVVARFASEIASSAITVRAARSYVNYSLI